MLHKVCIDGFNLSLQKGSGIATYGRNLMAAQKSLGLETHILYGPEAKMGRNNLMNEVALNDASPSPTWKQRIKAYFGTYLPPLERTATQVRRTGDVMPSPAMSRAVADVTWASEDIFHRANRSYIRFGATTPVRMGQASPAADLMHWTMPMPMKARGMPNIYTIHDLVPLRLPFATLDNKRRFYKLCKQLCKTADHIVTVSECARQDILRTFDISEDRVTNTYQMASLPPALIARPDADIANELDGIFGLPWQGYFLFFGAIEPKKNLGRVIEAYLSSGVEAPLVIIGGSAWLDEYETKMLYEDLIMVQSLKDGAIRRRDRIRRYDYLPLHSLVSLIRGAKATLFPSLYEGFGLPVLESMMLGTPVLTSTAGSLPEVAGDAAVSVNALDVDAIVAGIRMLDADDGLRADLSLRGRTQAEKFSADAYKDRLSALYARLD